MWQRFSERVRRVVFFAQEEAGRLGESYVSAEHLLLGLVRENDCVAAQVLDLLGVSPGRVRSEIERQVTRGDGRVGSDMQLTPRAKRVIDLAYDEARQLNDHYIGTEHLLLGLIREGEGLSSRVLVKLGVETSLAREAVRRCTQGGRSEKPVGWDGSAVGRPEAQRLIREDTLKLRGRTLLSIGDLSAMQVQGVLSVAQAMTKARAQGYDLTGWAGRKSLAMIFEKASLRTRVTFELGMVELGGIPVVLGPAEIGLGKRESVADVARNLGRWVSAVMARVFDHAILEELRDNAGIPVINGLSDAEHPCQTLADLLTLRQRCGTLDGLRIAWVGDGNNVLHSLMLGGALVGASVIAACPADYGPRAEVVRSAQDLAGASDRIRVVERPEEAADGADAIYTDAWVSMGQESESEARHAAFAPYQVDASLMALAKPDAVFLHCLPAHRGHEVTDDVLDGPRSVVLDQAENRLHAQKAVLALLIGG